MNDTNIGKAKKRTLRKHQRKALKLSPELLEFVNSPLSTTEIAARYGISPATLTVRAKRAGLPLRKRGRHPLKEPSPSQKKILAVAAIHGCQEAALRFDLSKQRVNKLQHRWKEWIAKNTDREPKATTRRKANQYTVHFRLGPDSFNQLKKLLQHPWFSRLESTNQGRSRNCKHFSLWRNPFSEIESRSYSLKTRLPMKKIMVRCPHCKEPFDLRTAMTPGLHAELVEHLELAALERSRIREEVVVELAQAHRLQALEQEKLISDLRASIQELQFSATRGSQQRAGEVLEIEVFNSFKRNFPHDEWARIGKGRPGADIIQRVRNAQGRDVGRVLWEIKNTANWSSKWIGKIRDDALDSQAQICVIVSVSLPKDIQNLGEIDGVWVSNLNCHSGLALALRSQLLTSASLREELAREGRSDEIREYVTSHGFKQRLKAIAFAAAAIEAQVEREKQFLTRHWAERQQLATSVGENLAALCLGIQGASQSWSEIVDNPVLMLEGAGPRLEGFPPEHV